jgi:hypothetical protein
MNLEIWLDAATQNLAPRAAAKVRDDITAHVESSVEHHQLEGMDEVGARALAIQELGDAHVSAQEFERAYLTTSEFERLIKNKPRD